MSGGKGNSFRVKCPARGKVLTVPPVPPGKKAKCRGRVLFYGRQARSSPNVSSAPPPISPTRPLAAAGRLKHSIK